MTDAASTDPYEQHRRERLRYLWRNYAVLSVEGGLFMGGMAFVAPNAVLPRLSELMHAPPWLVGLMPALMWVGIGLPPLFVAHHIERLPRYLPVVLLTGAFQRLPFLLAALALWFLGTSRPGLALVAVVLAPLVSGLFAGAGVTAWMELVARTLPPNKRASVFALRNVISASIGLAAGGLIAAVLSRFPGTQGFALLHLMTFVMMVASFVALSLMHETTRPPQNQGAPQSLLANLRSVPALLRAEPQLGPYMVFRGLTMGQFIMIPYLAIHALRVTGRADSYLGVLVALQMAGSLLGTSAAGWAGDRFGGKLIVMASNLLLLAVCIGSLFARSSLHFMVIFLIFGAGFFASRVGLMALSLEISPRDKRATSLGLMSLVNVVTMALASVLSGVAWSWGRGFAPCALGAAACLGAACLLLARLPEPRRQAG